MATSQCGPSRHELVPSLLSSVMLQGGCHLDYGTRERAACLCAELSKGLIFSRLLPLQTDDHHSYHGTDMKQDYGSP